MPSKNTPESFWMRAEVGPGCWLWRGGIQKSGYGKIVYEGRFYQAHRLAWELTNGPIAEGLCVCHRCDTPLCVRPDHLFLGTHIENMIDMKKKGRWRGGNKNGPCPRITPEQVQAVFVLRAAGESQPRIARSVGIAQSAVSEILRGVRKSLVQQPEAA